MTTRRYRYKKRQRAIASAMDKLLAEKLSPPRPTPAECCKFVAAQVRAMGYGMYADRIEELIAEVKKLKAPPPCKHTHMQGQSVDGKTEMWCMGCGKTISITQTFKWDGFSPFFGGEK